MPLTCNTVKFDQWMKTYGYNFSKPERKRRLPIFVKNCKKINKHNQDESQTFKKDFNHFAHLNASEWKNTYTGKNVPPVKNPLNVLKSSNENVVPLTDGVDWVHNGAVTSVKDQGKCGSCWTFSAVGAIEGAMKINGWALRDLSMQEIIDCDSEGLGCNGGSMDNAFQWDKRKTSGLCSLEEYPYVSGNTGVHGDTCASDTCTPLKGSKVEGLIDVKSTDSALMSAIGLQPVSVAIEADHHNFQFYKSGVLTSGCGNSTNHGVLAVGYGKTDGVAYYKIKNSWGARWGEDGYIRIAQGQCGILTMPSYPIVSKNVQPNLSVHTAGPASTSASEGGSEHVKLPVNDSGVLVTAILIVFVLLSFVGVSRYCRCRNSYKQRLQTSRPILTEEVDRELKRGLLLKF